MLSPLLLLTLLASDARGQLPPPQKTEKPASPAGEGEVRILAWPGAIESGVHDKRYDWVSGFVKASGCKVVAETAQSSEQMVELAPKFDVVIASSDAATRLVAAREVRPLEEDRVSGFFSTAARLREGEWASTSRGKGW